MTHFIFVFLQKEDENKLIAKTSLIFLKILLSSNPLVGRLLYFKKLLILFREIIIALHD